jgi:hypothetical protein
MSQLGVACRAVILVTAFAVSTGCTAVLTESQVREVRRFAEATQGYTELPGTLATSYGVLQRNYQLLAITREQYGQRDPQGRVDTAKANEAWQRLQRAYQLEHQFDDAGRRMDAALGVLRGYSAILGQLVSDEYTDALGARAAKLGQSLDKATEAFNTRFPDRRLDLVGSKIALAVRAAGGIYIRHRQAEILKRSVAEAHPLVQRLMDVVKDVALREVVPALKNYETNFLEAEFKAVANNTGRLDMGTVAAMYENLTAARTAQQLAERVARAAEAYSAAHRRLVDQTRVRLELQALIEEIETLKDEVNAGKAVKKRLEG